MEIHIVFTLHLICSSFWCAYHAVAGVRGVCYAAWEWAVRKHHPRMRVKVTSFTRKAVFPRVFLSLVWKNKPLSCWAVQSGHGTELPLRVTMSPGETWLARPASVLEQLPSYCSWNILCSFFGLFWLWFLVRFFLGGIGFWLGFSFLWLGFSCLFVWVGFGFGLFFWFFVYLDCWAWENLRYYFIPPSPPLQKADSPANTNDCISKSANWACFMTFPGLVCTKSLWYNEGDFI